MLIKSYAESLKGLLRKLLGTAAVRSFDMPDAKPTNPYQRTLKAKKLIANK